jgi:hypothetical protein
MTVRRGDPCTIPDCGKPVVGRGWCSMHYARWRTYGDPLHETRRYIKQRETCEVENCGEPPKTYSLCAKHLSRFRRSGQTTDPRQRRFWAQVDRRGEDECWEWTGRVQPNGYGNFGVNGTRLVHRIAYQWLVGPIPDGLVLDHLCHTRDASCADNAHCPHRRCVNPAHLEPVTPRENIARGRGGDSWGYVPPQRVAKPKTVRPSRCGECKGDKPIYKRGLCRPCYRWWLKDPERERPVKLTPEQRFWAKVEKTDSCWLWTASVNSATGYGRFTPSHGKPVDAHRFSYQLSHGTIPAGNDVHHVCHVRSCVNPAHLQAVSRSENLRMRKVRRT